jgi:uncharacterized protein YcaQ
MDLAQLRALAVSATLFPPSSLKQAIRTLGFVQADPIRAPARAQDLILRHRVNGYRAGDLERRYASLDVEEDLLYAYGFLPRALWQLLHPRRADRMTLLEKRVLHAVTRETHPNELEAAFGKKRVVNAWGGFSKATKDALERLHYRGLLRVARRENGIRVYAPSPPPDHARSAKERLRELVMVVAQLLAPSPASTLQAIAARLHRRVPESGPARVRELPLVSERVDGVDYLWPEISARALDDRVRILAPFDPVVWDRKRFEHLWKWPYRFEAYTPAKKRVRGYYAMPLLHRDRVIGWVNWSDGPEFGWVEKPREKNFSRELEAEVERFRSFL